MYLNYEIITIINTCEIYEYQVAEVTALLLYTLNKTLVTLSQTVGLHSSHESKEDFGHESS